MVNQKVMRNQFLKLLSFILLILFSFVSRGQMLNSLGMPSTNNSFFGQLGGATGVNVDLYTGAAQINVPLLSLAAKDFAVPVSLSYIGGKGIRLQDYASFVGLGWQLKAGGSLTRVVKCLPDESPEGYLGPKKWGPKLRSAVTNNTTIPSEIEGSSTQIPTADGEPDVFFVQTPTFSCQFVYGAYDYVAITYPANIGIQVISNNFHGVTGDAYLKASFEIIDPNGNHYFFGSSSNSREKTEANLLGQDFTYTSTWYLDKIVTFNAKETIDFSYVEGQSYELVHYTSTALHDDNCGRKNMSNEIKNKIIDPKYVKTIKTSLSQLDFSYAYDRRDLANDARLTAISQKAFNHKTSSFDTELQTYYFLHSYFGEPSMAWDELRLKLDQIILQTPMQNLVHKKFIYNQSVNLPSRKSKAFDYWGYYNSIVASDDPMVEGSNLREANETYSKANILTEIEEGTGLKWKLTYAANEGYLPNYSSHINIVKGGGLRVNKLSQVLATGETIETNYNYEANGFSSGQVYSDKYNSMSYHLINHPNKVQVFSENPNSIYDINGSFIAYSHVKVNYKNGGYAIYKFTSFSDFPDEFENNSMLTQSKRNNGYKRGLPLEVAIYTDDGKIVSKDAYTYDLPSAIPQQVSVGRMNYCSVYKTDCFSSPADGILPRPIINYFKGVYWYYYEDVRPPIVTHRDFDQNDQTKFIETVTKYTYYGNHTSKIETKDSKGQNVIKQMYYPDAINGSNTIPMVAKNSTEETVVGNLWWPTNKIHNLNALIHQSTEINGIKMEQHNRYSSQHVSGKTLLVSSESYKNNTLLSKQYFTYNANLNLIGNSDMVNRKGAILYGYNNTYPIAKATNANANEIYYESFENNQATAIAHTGNSAFVTSMGTYTTSFLPPNSRSYTIQWWTLNTLTNTWDFNESVYVQGMQLNGTIDDVRIFPKDATISTCTYDILVGKSSEIDPSGRTICYKYDDLGMQTLVLDGNGLILKKNDYTLPTISKYGPIIFAKIYIENKHTYYDPAGIFFTDYGDVVIRFYKDVNCLYPYNIANVDVFLNHTESYDDCALINEQLGYNSVENITGASGNILTVGNNIELRKNGFFYDNEGNPSFCIQSNTYVLHPSSNYVIVK